MARIRFTRAEAEAEATRRAEEFVGARPDRDRLRHGGTYPNSTATQSRSSKHPLAWIVVFEPIPQNGEVMDGGELFVAVDLESGSVGIYGW